MTVIVTANFSVESKPGGPRDGAGNHGDTMVRTFRATIAGPRRCRIVADHEGLESLASITHDGVTLYYLTPEELKAHDAEVAAAVLQDAADEVDGHGVIPSGITNDYWEGWTDAVEKIRDVLRARADEGNPR